MRTVRLFGKLAKQFTDKVDLEVSSAAEAIRALCANFPGFETFMIQSESMGLRYKVVVAGDAISDVSEIHNPASGFIDIIPVVKGAGGPVERILVGAALIAAAVLMPASIPALIPQIVGSIGVSLALGGISQLLSPAPTAPKPGEKPENTPSNYFNGPVNTSLQGQAVSLAYGRVICGSAVVSAGISLEQIKAGFKVVRTESTVDIDAQVSESGYVTTPPANWYKRELLSKEKPGFVWIYHYRFYYYTETLVAI